MVKAWWQFLCRSETFRFSSTNILSILKLSSYSYFFHSFYWTFVNSFLMWTELQRKSEFLSVSLIIFSHLFFPLEILLDQISCLLDLSAISVNFSLNFVYLFICFTIIEWILLYPFLSFCCFFATSSSLQDFGSLPGDWTWTTAVEVWFCHWTARSFQMFLYPLTFQLLLSF